MDCLEGMGKIDDNSIDLIVTSPPYNANKEYGVYDDSKELEEWLSLIESFLKQSYRIISDRSRVCVNLPWVMLKKPQRFIPHIVATCGEKIGYYIRDWVIWDKGVAPSTAWGSWLSPSGPVIRARYEPIIIFQKGIGGKKRIDGTGRGRCVKGDLTSKEFLEYTENVWQVRGRKQDAHPAMFPEEIPKRLIQLYTWKGDVILDQFLGSGTTTVVAKRLQRKYIGFDINPEYVDIANKQLEQTTLNEVKVGIPPSPKDEGILPTFL